MSTSARARRARRPENSSKDQAAFAEPIQPTWVVEMHRHFGAHGCYRASDLDRVLGSPVGFTEGEALTTFIGNSGKDSQ